MDIKTLQDDRRLHREVRRRLAARVGSAADEFEGEAWLRARALRERFNRGEVHEELSVALEHAVRAAVDAVNREQRRAGSKSGAFGTQIDAQLRDLPVDGTSRDARLLDQGELWERALERATPTMRRNLAWWRRRRISGDLFATIAEEHDGDVAESTVRGGVARAERFLRRVMDELRSQPWQRGSIEHEAVHEAFKARDHERLFAELERLRPYERDAHLLNYEGVAHMWREDLDEARAVLREALVWADRPGLRCNVTNNLGNVEEEAGAWDEALYWYDRARALAPRSPTPLLNLLGVVCKRAAPELEIHDRARVLHYIDHITRLLSSRALSEDDRAYLLRRLRDNPDFAPARRNTCWKRIHRWLQREAQPLDGPQAAPLSGPGVRQVSR
jgi:tetratricopeptide (TPR) repeat protein